MYIQCECHMYQYNTINVECNYCVARTFFKEKKIWLTAVKENFGRENW